MDLDETLARELQNQFDLEVGAFDKNSAAANSNVGTRDVGPSTPLSLADDYWEIADPNPDVHALFLQFNDRFFWGRLVGVEVRWSPRMTLCAGLCCYEGRGGLCSVRLSVPLLKLRPRKDLVDTLLHEMIHAYLFVTHNNKDHGSHGPEFHKHMSRINRQAGTSITVYHTFHDEVNVYKQHWWKCNGPCHKRPPYFGLVKRAMNRKPSPNDPWWNQHQQTCGGTYVKIKEPDGYKSKNLKKDNSDKENESRSSSGVDGKDVVPFSGKGRVLGGKPREEDKGTKSKVIGDFFKRMVDGSCANSPIAKPLATTSVLSSSSTTSRTSTSATSFKQSTIDNLFNGRTTSGSIDSTQSKSEIRNLKSEDPKDNLWKTDDSSRKRKLSNHDCLPKPDKLYKISDSGYHEHLSLAGSSKSGSACVDDDVERTRVVGSSSSVTVIDLTENYVPCPVCGARIEEKSINSHLDLCLSS